MRSSPAVLAVFVWVVACACSSGVSSFGDAGVDRRTVDASTVDAARHDANPCPVAGQARCGATCIDVTANDDDCGACGKACAGGEHCVSSACRPSAIEHVVLIVQENH